MVAGRDDDEQDERGIERRGRLHESTVCHPGHGRPDDERVAEVHARDCGVGVVERADEARVEVDVTARDGVCDPDPAQPWWGGRVDEVADERKSAREHQCRANQRKGGGTPPVEPEQHADRDSEVKREVGDAEQVDQPRERVCGVLHALLEEQARRALQRDKLARVTYGFGGVADNHAARELIQPVQHKH
jgi:hypothetical protein